MRTLGWKFRGGRPQDFEDAIAEGFLKFLAKGKVLDNPAGYITAVAINYVKRFLTRTTRRELPTGDFEDDGGDPWADPTTDRVIGETAFRTAQGMVEQWESKNIKAATLLVLEAAALGEPIGGTEIAEELEDRLGEDVLPDTARQWKKRGLDRLRAELGEIEEGKKEFEI